MIDPHPGGVSVPDALITWTTACALIAFGVLFFDDAVIMGRTILTLGLLIATNEGLKLHATRSGPGSHGRLRLLVAVAYLVLVLIGFFFPPAAR